MCTVHHHTHPACPHPAVVLTSGGSFVCSSLWSLWYGYQVSISREHRTVGVALVRCLAAHGGACETHRGRSVGWCRAAAIQTLVTVFTAMDPVAKRWWQCVDPDDKVCRAALASLKPDVCGLPREAWQWTRRFAQRPPGSESLFAYIRWTGHACTGLLRSKCTAAACH